MSLRLPLVWKSSNRDPALTRFPEFRLTTLSPDVFAKTALQGEKQSTKCANFDFY
jgi:hypothetical protein